MDTPEFEKANYEYGLKNLLPLGYEYKNKQWSIISAGRQLSFCLAKDKNSPHFKIKYLTLSLRDLDVRRKDMANIKPYSDISQWGAIQISPEYLSGKRASSWHYVNPLKSLENRMVYLPVYYGGKASLFGGSTKTVVAKQSVEQFGAEYISEKEALKKLNSAQQQVSKYGTSWAEAVSKEVILQQLKDHNENWLSERQWIEAYEEAKNA